MGWKERIAEKRFAGATQEAQAAPQKGLAGFWYLTRLYFWRIMGINLLFLLCCVPVLTIPASLCALNRYLVKMVRDRVGFSVHDYWKEWRAQLLPALPAGILCFLPLFYGVYLISMSLGGQARDMVFAFGLFWVMVGVLLAQYLFVLMSMVQLPFGQMIKNTVLLIFAEWKTSLAVLALSMAVLLIALATIPYSAVLLGVFGIAWVQLGICSLLQRAVQKRVIAPYEEAKQKETQQTGEPM